MERRNQIYGPFFFDTDLTIMKNFRIPGWESGEFQIGAQAFNLFNHPNFDQPVGDVSNTQFGQSIRTVATPTSIFGSFLGADASPRPADPSSTPFLAATPAQPKRPGFLPRAAFLTL